MSTQSRRNRTSDNVDKQMLRKLYQQSAQTQHDLHKHTDPIVKDQTFISSNNQNYSPEEISRAYNFLCQCSEQGNVNVKSLIGFLEEQGESLYTGVQMISLLDGDNKGYVAKEDFFAFFQKGIHQLQPQTPQQMKRDQQLVKAIDKNYDGLLKNFMDPEYCEYAAKEIKRYKYSQQL